VVIVFASQQAYVQVESAISRKRLQQVRDHLAAQSTDHRATKRQVDARPTAATQVDGYLCQGFIQRHDGVAETTNCTPFAERLV